MEKNRGSVIAIVAALVVAVISLGVAFAAFSTTLNITGSATVQASSWNVFFTNTSTGSDPGTTTGVNLTASLSNLNGFTTTATSTSSNLKSASFTWAGTLKTPGDKIMYTFYIRNTGSYNAKITSINVPTLTCKQGGSVTTAATALCNNRIKYGVFTDTDGTTRLQQNATLNATSGVQTVYVIAEFDKNTPASELPGTAVTIEPSTISITYTQY
jgi:hypothetical protein